MSTSGHALPSSDETYLSYVSPLLLRRLGSPGPVEPIVAPDVERLRGAVVLLDVERFSAFAERMSSRGSEGVEQLATRVNETFATVVDSIERHGGIAHSFPGDSVIALWPADTRSDEEAALLAASCSLELLEQHRESELPLKAGMAFGDVRIAHVGGIGGRLQLLLSGEPLERMGRAEERSSRGRLVASEEAWRLLAPHAMASVDAAGFFDVGSLRFVPPLVVNADASPPWSGSCVETARAYLPAALLRQLDAGHAEWLGEFREVTTVFIQIRTPGVAADDFASVQEAFRSVQRALFRYGGDVARFAHDDKGLAVLAVFGLPPAPAEDAPARAVLAGLQLEADAGASGFGCRVGIATGRVFCGTLGAPRRREYSVVGSTANLAARLMQTAEDGLLCDARTANASASAATFAAAGSRALKGFAEPVALFRPRGAVSRSLASPPESRMVGREAERQRIHGWVDGIQQMLAEHRGGARQAESNGDDRRGCLAVVQGEAGIGKSTLVRDAVDRASHAGLHVVRIACEAVQSASTYASWSKAISALLRLDELPSRVERTARVRRALDAAGVAADVAPLVAPVLDVELEETRATREMTASGRADNLLALLSRLVAHEAASLRDHGGGLLLVLEDVHWLDAASWELLGVVTRALDASVLGILATLRSESAPASPHWHAIVSAEHTERIALPALSRADTKELALHLLGAPDVTEQLLQLVCERTRGNPFFCRQLLAEMSESGLVGVEGGMAALRTRSPEQAEELVPRSIAAVVTSRLDRLPAPQQLTLKAASVIGQHFRVDVLRAVHPKRIDERVLRDHLDSALELGILEAEGSELRFQHAITCDVAYGLLLVSQKRQLHRAVAQYLAGRGDSAAAHALLFYHWRRSGDEERALAYVDTAGAEAMRNGDYHAVIDLYGYALQLTVRPGARTTSPGGPSREAVWSAHLGQAQVALGLHEAARPNLELSLELLGERARRGTIALAGAIAREGLRQVAHRMLPARFEGSRQAETERLALAAGSFEQLGYVYYAAGDITPGMYASMRILNLAELARSPRMMARSYGMTSLAASVVRQHALAAVYDRHAVEIAREHGDAETSAYVGWITSVRAMGEARLDLATMRVEPAIRLAEQIGDRRLVMTGLTVLAGPPYLRGDFETAIAIGERQLAMMRESNNRLWEAWALNGIAEPAVMTGDWDRAIRCCRRSLAVLAEESDLAERVRALGLLAVSLLRSGDSDEAWSTARLGIQHAEQSRAISYILFEGLAGLCEVMLGLAEVARAKSGGAASSLRRDLRRALSVYARFSKTFALGRPRLHTMRGRAAMLAGSASQARAELDRSLAEAESYGMSHAKGLALLAAARCEAFDKPTRQRRAEEALGVLRGGEARREAHSIVSELS